MRGATDAGGAGTAMMLAPGESARLAAPAGAEIFAIVLPPITAPAMIAH
jgi:hypothetical protein